MLDGFIKDHMINLTYGGVAPVPDVVKFAINTYSKDDVTMFFANKYLDKKPKPSENIDKAMDDLAKDIKSQSLKNEKLDCIQGQLRAGINQIYISEYPYESNKNGYSLRIIESMVPKSQQPLIEKDHAFLGDTYQEALARDLDLIRDNFKIYECK